MNARLSPTALLVGALVLAAVSQASAQAGADALGAEALQPGVEVRLRDARTPRDEAGPTLAEESALRYFASQGDRARIQAEIEKLQARYPGWTPPEDLYGAASEVDERPLWALYENGDVAGARELIGRLETEHPEWSPLPSCSICWRRWRSAQSSRRSWRPGALPT
jgi:hypothetical protein